MNTFETQVTGLVPALTRFAQSLTHSHDHAADLVQDTIERALRKAHLFAPDTNLRGWLFTITKSRVVDLFRRQEKEPPTFSPDFDQPQAANSPAADAELSALVHRALKVLKTRCEPQTYEAFWRTAVGGEKSAVVAESLGMTAVAVRQAKSRLLRQLREMLADDLET